MRLIATEFSSVEACGAEAALEMSVGLVVTITMIRLKMETIAVDYVADCAGCLLLYYIMFFIFCFL